MSEYRAHLFDANGQVIGQHDLACDNDEEALELARLLIDAHGVEVWQHERIVFKLPRK